MGNTADGRRAVGHPSRAVMLLRKLIATQSFERDDIVQALVVTDSTFGQYLSETLPIPLDRQLCLALFVIEKVPSLARAGHQLRGQVAATLAFHEHATETHLQPPQSGRF